MSSRKYSPSQRLDRRGFQSLPGIQVRFSASPLTCAPRSLTGTAGKGRVAMLAKKFLAVAVLGFLGIASTALADHGDQGRGRGHAYGHYKRPPAVVVYTPPVVSARVVNVEPMVRY